MSFCGGKFPVEVERLAVSGLAANAHAASTRIPAARFPAARVTHKKYVPAATSSSAVCDCKLDRKFAVLCGLLFVGSQLSGSRASCHHMPDPGQHDSGCGHGHSHAPAVTALPDNPAISGANLASISSALPAKVAASEIVQHAAAHSASRWHGSSPGRSLFLLLSVLRI